MANELSASVDIFELLTHHASLRPRHPALVDADGAMDFQTLKSRSVQLASALTTAGVGPGDRVALRLPNSRRHYECFFACVLLGAVLVPIDNTASAEEVSATILDSGARLFVDNIDTYDELVSKPSGALARTPVSRDAALLIMYTSGTTGTPKGVILTHENIFFTSINQISGWQLTEFDRVLVVAPFHHIGGLVMGLPCLQVGGTVHISSPFHDEILETIERERITALFLPPRLWRRIAHSTSLYRMDLRNVRLCASGGDAIPVSLLKILMQAFSADFTGAYGLTEAASCSTILQGSDIIRHTGTVGKPLAYNHISIFDSDGRVAKIGEIGEIVQSGPTIMKGYWKRPADTDVAIRDGKLFTGDLGFIDESGFLHVVGRTNDIIDLEHTAVYPLEMEHILREYPAVDEAAVIGLHDDQAGPLVAAIVTSRTGKSLKPAEVIRHCVDAAGGDKVPHVVFVASSLPLTSSGKIDRRKLRAIYANAAVGLPDR